MSKIFKISQAHKEACSRLVQTQDFQLVQELLQEYLDKIIDIRYLSTEEKTMDKNIVWVGRKAGYESLKSFLNIVDLLGEKSSKSTESFE